MFQTSIFCPESKYIACSVPLSYLLKFNLGLQISMSIDSCSEVVPSILYISMLSASHGIGYCCALRRRSVRKLACLRKETKTF